MAYTAGSAYLISGGLTSSVPRIWGVTSSDSTGTVDTTAFISDGSALGMKAKDLVYHTNSVTGLVTAYSVVTVTASSGVDLSDSVAVTSTSNSD